MRWLTVIAIFLQISTSWAFDSSAYRDYRDQLLSDVGHKFGDPEAFNQSIVKPLSGDGAVPMPVGNATASVTLLCSNATKSVNIHADYDTSTGDLVNLRIDVDDNFDGTVDYSRAGTLYGIQRVSGVCTGGVVQCDPGTWDNCVYYRWALSGGEISLVSADASSTGSCVAVNHSSGHYGPNNEWWEMLATGAGNAWAAGPDSVMLEHIDVNPPDASVWVRKMKYCNADSGTLPASYLDNPALLNNSNTEVQNLMLDPNSPYQLALKSPAWTEHPSTVVECQKTRSVTFNPTTCDFSETINDDCTPFENDSSCILQHETVYDYSGRAYITVLNRIPQSVTVPESCYPLSSGINLENCVLKINNSTVNDSGVGTPSLTRHDDYALLTIGRTVDDYLTNFSAPCKIFQANILLQTDIPQAIKQVILEDVHYEDVVELSLDGTILFTGPNDPNENYYLDPPDLYDPSEFPDGSENCDNQPAPDFWEAPFRDITRYFKTRGTHEFVFKIGVKKKGSGYFRVRFYLNPPDRTFCYPWWRIKRTYICEKTATIDLDAAKKRVSGVDVSYDGQIHVSETSATVVNPLTATVDFSLQDMNSTDLCMEKMCKVKLPVDDSVTEANFYRTRQDPRASGPISSRFAYRRCNETGGIWTCPVGPDETIEQDCGCLNDFPAAFGAMKIFEIIGSDIICADH